jgi:nicotinamidase-related amidase
MSGSSGRPTRGPEEIGDAPAEQRARDWSPFALLLIDVQHDFWPEATAARFPEFPANVARLLAFCRAEGIDVVHLRARFRPDRSDWMVNAKLRGRTPCIDGTPGAETLPFARERPGEAVIVKHTWDGFQDPELPAYLCDRGKRFLLIAGLVTSVCVLFTAASAAQRGFLTAVVEDCCADRPEAHEQTLTRYGGLVFRRTTVDGLFEGYVPWSAALRRLEELKGPVAVASGPHRGHREKRGEALSVP